MSDYTVRGHNLALDPSQKIGEGGQGTVYQDYVGGTQVAVKILYDAFCNGRYFEKIAKLSMMDLHPDIIKPIDVVKDSRGQSSGYVARLLPKNEYDGVSWYFDESYRTQYGITVADIAEIFYDLLLLMHHWHDNGIVIGDFNHGSVMVLHKNLWSRLDRSDSKYVTNFDGNRVFLPKQLKVSMVDIDSVQFGSGYPCDVYSIDTFDYRVVRKLSRLGQDAIFDKGSDYFSFGALLFHSLIGVGIYSGYHQHYDLQRLMMQNGVTVLHPDVAYPAHALPMSNLPIDLQQYYQKLLTDVNFRKPIGRMMLKKLGAKVDLYTRPEKPAVQNASVGKYERLLSNVGLIVDVVVQGDVVYVLRLDNKHQKFVLHSYGPFGTQSFVIANNTGHRVKLNNGLSVIASMTMQGESSYMTKSYQWHSILSEGRGMNTPHSGVSGDFAFRESAQYINIYSLLDGNIQHPPYRTVMKSGKNLDLYPLGHDGYAYAITRMETWEVLTLITPKYTLNPKIQHRNQGEAIRTDGFHVSMSGDYAYVSRHTDYQGKHYTLYDWIDFSDYLNVKVYSIRVEGHRHVAKQVALFGKVILYPSNDGIVRERISGEWDVFSQTCSIVSGHEKLLPYRKGLLIVDSDSVSYIEL